MIVAIIGIDNGSTTLTKILKGEALSIVPAPTRSPCIFTKKLYIISKYKPLISAGKNNAEIVFLGFKKSTSKKRGINLLLKIVLKKTKKDNGIQSSKSF